MPKTKSEPKKLKQANKSPNKKQQPILSAAQRRAKAKRTLTIFGMIVAVILGLIIYFGFGLNTLQERGDMARYLEDKYGKEFVVENYRVQGAGLAVEGDAHADAYPKGEPSLKFDVRDIGKFNQGNHAYKDQYVGVKWAYDERSTFDQELNEILGYTPEYTLDIILVDEASNQIDKDNFLTLEQAAEKYSDSISYRLRVTSNINRTELDKTRFAQEYVKIASLAPDNLYSMTVSYNVLLSKGQFYGIVLDEDELAEPLTPESVMDNYRQWSVS